MIDVNISWNNSRSEVNTLHKRIIDPSDPESPLVWLCLRRYFLLDSKQIKKANQVMIALEVMIVFSAITLGYVFYEYLTNNFRFFTDLLTVALFLYFGYLIAIISVTLQKIVEAQMSCMEHVQKLKKYRNMIEMTINKKKIDAKKGNIFKFDDLIFNTELSDE